MSIRCKRNPTQMGIFAGIAALVLTAAGGTGFPARGEPPPQPPAQAISQAGEQCITDAELMSSIVFGIIIAQLIQAERCDAFYRREDSGAASGLVERHEAILAKHGRRLAESEARMTAYFLRRYGPRGAGMRLNAQRATERRQRARIVADRSTCSEFAGELRQRRARDWAYIEAKLERGMRAARRLQPGLERCGE
ncbi:MAG: hypothetical protein IIA41_12295 [SAR324 cluster bacterium]|nr:hypothetical protein [SAR324 cluster bacterium]